MNNAIIKFVLLSTFIFFSIGCGESSNLKISPVGYYKSDNKTRYNTFNVAQYNDSFKDEVIAHGKKQINTSGKVTASFYYLNNAPDITLSNNPVDVAHNSKPFLSVWKMPNGEINVFDNPK